MSGRALLIGAGHRDLRGAENDVAAMAAALSRRGFEVRRCVRDDATRAAILSAYEQLIEQVAENEPALVFFSGHGGYADAPERDGLPLQFIVPNDYDTAAVDDFRGITSVELSILQDRLCAKTKNVTVVLDCCHSGQLARDPWRRKLVPVAPYARLRAHLDRLEAAGLAVGRWRNEGSEHAVRVVACSPAQSAVEDLNDDGVTMGVLTDSLVRALVEAEGHPVTWAAVMDRVRSRIVGRSYRQRPEVEGPVHRRIFELAEAERLMSLPVAPLGEDGLVRLDCAALLAVQTGDEFMVMPSEALHAEHSGRIGDLIVTGVDAFSARGRVTPAPGMAVGAAALMGAHAFRTRMQAPRIRVRVPVDDPRAAGLVAALGARSLVEVVRPTEPDWVAEVRIEADGRLSACDRRGPLHPPRDADPAGVNRVAGDLKILAQATQLRRLVHAKQFPLDAEADIEWGLVIGGERSPLVSGAVVPPGERIYVRVHNHGAAVVYVSMLDIGITGKIALLTRGAPSGWPVHPGETYTLGEDRRARILKGAPVTWPEGVDAVYGRAETILVVITSDRQDLRALEQPGIARGRARSAVVSPLQSMIDQLATGDSRDLRPQLVRGIDPVRYDIEAIAFDVAAPG